MLELLIVVFVLLWVTGFVFVPATGGAIHVLLVVALVLIVLRLLRGQSLLP